MKQQKIHIVDTNGKVWGIKHILSMHWRDDIVYSIIVDWYGNGRDGMSMSDFHGDGEFKNSHGNLSGHIVEEMSRKTILIINLNSQEDIAAFNDQFPDNPNCIEVHRNAGRTEIGYDPETGDTLFAVENGKLITCENKNINFKKIVDFKEQMERK